MKFVFIGLFVFFLSSSKSDPPTLAMKKVSDSISVIQQTDTAEIVYLLTNTGTDKLIISDFDLSCPCTSTTLSKNMSIPGGQSTRVTFFVDGKKLTVGTKNQITVAIRANTTPSLHILTMDIKAL